ncbi:CpsD/CapB family tyrosine-protein kinase [Enterococcus sp. LJL98]
MAKKQKQAPAPAVGLITLTEPEAMISEQYRTLRTNLQFIKKEEAPLQTLVITSALPGEGKSTTAANLAVVLAQAGQKTLLVDADLRKPTFATIFGLPSMRGLSTSLAQGDAVLEACQTTEIPQLSVLTSGPKPPNPSELLDSKRMEAIIQELKQAFDVILFDVPPVMAVTDAQIMAAKADGTLLVIREKVANKEALKKTKSALALVDATILGAVYNGTTQTEKQGYYYE